MLITQPNAITGQSERNLRRLRARYGNDMAEVYRSTVLHGRPDKGMPVWDEILDAKTIELIYGYLKSVQSEPGLLVSSMAPLHSFCQIARISEGRDYRWRHADGGRIGALFRRSRWST